MHQEYQWWKALTRPVMIIKSWYQSQNVGHIPLATIFIALKMGLNSMYALPPQDPRFNAEVDLITGYKTQSILCLPIKNHRDEVRQYTPEQYLKTVWLVFNYLQ